MTKTNQIHNAVWNWLFNGDNGISDLCFIAGQYDKGGLILNNQVIYTPETAGKDEWIKRYTDGGGIKQYSFVVSQFAPMVCQSNTPANIVTLNTFERVVEWVENQAKAELFPSFPSDCSIQKIEATPATIAAQDESGVKLQFTVRIEYYKENE